MALARYEGVAQDRAGNVIPFATIEVRKDQPGRPVVPLFSDRNGTVGIGNPITANELGQFGFHVLGGVYYIRVFTGPTQAPFQQFTKRYVAVGTAAERDVEELASSLNAGMGIFATFAGLELFTPEADNVGARVINDPNPALNGDYLYVTDTWVKQRGLPDTLARMDIVGGTADAIEAAIAPGVDPAAVVMLLLTPAAANTGPVTINGIDLVAFDGAPLEAGWLEAGVPVLLFANGDGDYQLTSDVRFQSLAAETFAARDETITARDKAEEWAENPEDVAVEPGQFSAKHHAIKAAASDVAAAGSASTATTQAGLAVDAKNAAEALYGDLAAVEQARDESQAAAIVSQAARDAAIAAAEASGDVVFYDNKATATAAVGGLPDQQIVEVFNDEDEGGARTRYRVESGVLVFKTVAGMGVDDTFTPTFTGAVPTTIRSILEREVQGLGTDRATDNTSVLEAAWARATGTVYDNLTGELSFMDMANYDFNLPPGRFLYTGTGLEWLTRAPIIMTGASGWATEIVAPEGAYLMDLDGYVTALEVRGIKFTGGKGAYRSTSTANNVGGRRVFRDCIFSNYSECAINESGTDSPNFEATGNIFVGKGGEPTIGIALSGYTDITVIRRNLFLRNKINIKFQAGIRAGQNDLGPAPNTYIGENDMTRFIGTDTPTVKVADIWIEPNPEISTNAGYGLVIDSQKFGNENYVDGQYKILVADVDRAVGTENGSQHTHKTTKSNGYLGLLTVDNSNFQYAGSENYEEPAPLYSFTRRLHGLRWREGNTVTGTPPKFAAVQFDPAAEYAGEEPIAHSIVQVGPMEYDSTRRYRAVSEPGMALVVDPAHLVQSDLSVPAVHHAGYDPAYVQLLASGTAHSSGGVSNATRSGSQPDILGGTNATELTFSTDTGFLYFQPDKASVDNARLAWFEVDLKQAASQAILGVMIGVRSGDGWWIDRRAVLVPPSWQTFRFPLVLPPIGAAQYRFQIMPIAADWEIGVADKVLVGRPKLYHARNPVNNGHLEMRGSGQWNGEHGILGTAMRFFVDAGNRLRLKFSLAAPTSDTDGAIVMTYQVVTTGTRPTTNLFLGRFVLDQTIGKWIWWNGSNWSDTMGNSGV